MSATSCAAMVAPGSLTDVDDTVLMVFSELLDEWELLAAGDAMPFTWHMDLDTDQLVALAEAFHGLVVELAAAAEPRGFALAPPAGQVFYDAVVDAMLAGLLAAADLAIVLGTRLEATLAWSHRRQQAPQCYICRPRAVSSVG
ncbi:MAG: hypothetical protein R2699_05240 [Acidimicrobiales bacterium]